MKIYSDDNLEKYYFSNKSGIYLYMLILDSLCALLADRLMK